MYKNDSRASHLFLVAVVLIWGANPGIVKSAYQDLPPIFFAAIRFTLSGLLMLLLIYLKEGDLRFRKEDWKAILIVGGLGIGAYQIFWSLGLHRTTATNSAILIFVQSLFGVVWAGLTKKEKVGKGQYLGMTLAFVGVILVVMKPTAHLDFSTETLWGDLLTLMAGVVYTIFFSIWPKPLLRVYSPLRLMGFCMVIGAGVLWMAVPWSGWPMEIKTVRWEAWGALGYAAFLAGMVGHTFYYEGIGRLGVARTFIFMYFIPFLAAVFNFFFLGETLFLQQVLGGVIILTGIHFGLRR